MPPLLATAYAHKGWAFALALAAMGAAIVISQVGRNTRFGLLLGKDQRLSTSKTVAAAWTVVVAYILILLLFNWPDSWDAALKHLSPTYLLLLGGPYAALVLAKAAVVTRVANGSLSKSPAGHTSLGDLFNDDEGQPDLFDVQYVIFNVIAIVFVLTAVGRATTMDPGGFPPIPDGLALLTGGPAAVYVSNKFFGSDAPTIFNVAPTTARIGETFTISGQNLAASTAGAAPPSVTVGAKDAPVVTATSTTITATAPDVGADVGRSLGVTVKTAAGAVAYLDAALTIGATTIELYGADTGEATVGDIVTLRGDWTDDPETTPLVVLDGSVLGRVRTHTAGVVSFVVPPLADLTTTRSVPVKVAANDGQSNVVNLHVSPRPADAGSSEPGGNGTPPVTVTKAASLRPRTP